MTKKMGRPTDNPKNNKITVRFDDECMEKIEKYCKANGTNRVEAIRIAVKSLKTE